MSDINHNTDYPRPVKSRRNAIIHLAIGASLLALALILAIYLSPDMFADSPGNIVYANSGNLTYLDYDYLPVIEKTVYSPIFTHQWESVEQCQSWVEAHLTLLFIGDHPAFCADYASNMQDRAMQEGYPVSQALTSDTLYYGKTVTGIQTGHAGCMVFINPIRKYYWFDPNPEYYKGLVFVTEAK